MFQNLPTEIQLEVGRYLSVRDIIQLQRCNRALNCFVKYNDTYIVTDKFQIDLGNKDKNYMYTILTYTITEMYKVVSRKMLWHYSHSSNYNFSVKEGRLMVLQQIYGICVCDNELINHLFRKVFYWYYTNPSIFSHEFRSVTVWRYPNQIELYVLYRFLLISLYRNEIYSSPDSNIDLIDDFIGNGCGNHHIYQMGTEYFKYIIENKTEIRFDSLYKISKYVVGLPMIKRLFGCRKLTINHSQLTSCCDECNSEALNQIVTFKTNRPDDYLLSENYKTIKSFLLKHNVLLYRELTNLENRFINARIFYRHPVTRRRVRLDSNVSCRLFYKYHYQYDLLRDNWSLHSYDRIHYEYNHLQRYILKRKKQLFYHYFL